MPTDARPKAGSSVADAPIKKRKPVKPGPPCPLAPADMTCLRKQGHKGECDRVYNDDLGVAVVVRSLIAERGWTQTAVAEAVGVTQKHMSQMLTGKVGIHYSMLQRIGRAMGCRVRLELVPDEQPKASPGEQP